MRGATEAKKYSLPPEFAKVLKDFTREVLREQPEDIYAYGADYFKSAADAEAKGGK